MAFCVVVTNVVNPGAFSLKMVVFWLRLTTFVTSAAHWSPGQAPPPPINFARNSPVVCSIIEFALLELQRFWGVSKNDHDKLRAKCGGGGVVAARGHRQPGPVGQAACLCETPVAFAGEKWAFLVRFSVALVMVVSMVAVQRRALVMMVSRWPASVAAEVSLVSTSPRGCVLCTKKFALRVHNGPKLVFSGVPGELFRGNAAGGPLPGEVFRGPAVVGSHGASCGAPRPW